MTFSLTIFCILLLFAFKGKPYRKAANIFIILISISLVLCSGLRHESIGNDTVNYLNMFEDIKLESWKDLTSDFFSKYFSPTNNQDKDPGYSIFIKITQIFTSNSRAYLFIIAIIFFISLGKFLKEHTESLQELLFSYVFYINLFNEYVPNSAIRQTLAISIIFFAYTNLQKKRYLLFFVYVILASFFHKSALICLLVLPMTYLKNIDKLYYLGIPLFLLSLLCVNQFASLFLSNNDIYNDYLSGSYYGNSEKPFVILILMVGLYLIGLLGIISDKNLTNTKLFYVGAFCSLLFSTLVWVNPTLIRLMTYFAPLMGIAIGNAFNRISCGKMIYAVVILIFLISAFRSIGDYHFMWEPILLIH